MDTLEQCQTQYNIVFFPFLSVYVFKQKKNKSNCLHFVVPHVTISAT